MSYHDTNPRQTTLGTATNHLTNTPSDDESHPFQPLATADGVDRDDYTNVVIDHKVHSVLREYARKRAPNRRSIDRHLVGVVGEYAVAAWKQITFNAEITGDYEGDDGYDLEIPRDNQRNERIEVKTTRKQEPKATIKREKIDSADWFVLCRTNRGADQVDIIGYASRSEVKKFGKRYGINGYQLTPEYLRMTDGMCISSDDVRAVSTNYY